MPSAEPTQDSTVRVRFDPQIRQHQPSGYQCAGGFHVVLSSRTAFSRTATDPTGWIRLRSVSLAIYGGTHSDACLGTVTLRSGMSPEDRVRPGQTAYSHLSIGYSQLPSHRAADVAWKCGVHPPPRAIRALVSGGCVPLDCFKYVGMFHVKPEGAAAGTHLVVTAPEDRV